MPATNKARERRDCFVKSVHYQPGGKFIRETWRAYGSGALYFVGWERREQTIAARDRRAKLPRLLRGHKSYSSNVNINETNELSVMPVMTVDCCRNKRSAGFHVAVVTTRTGPALLLYRYRWMCILANGTLAMRARFLYRLYWGKGVAYRSPFSFHRIFILKKIKITSDFFPYFEAARGVLRNVKNNVNFFLLLFFIHVTW